MQFKEIGKQALDLFKGLSPARRAAAIAALLALIAVATFAVTWQPEVEYRIVFTDLAEPDAAAIAAELDATKTPYRLDNREGGMTLLVPRAQADRIRLDLAGKDLPGSSVGLDEYLRNKSYEASSTKEKLSYSWALANELAKTIRTIDAVRDARVIVSSPPRQIFKAMNEPPTASVIVHLHRSKTLDQEEIRGIVNLVAKSVVGLKPSLVTLVDRSGRALWQGGDEAQVSMARKSHETAVRQKVSALLERLLGPQQYHVEVTATYERSKVHERVERYDPENTAVISEETSEEQRTPAIVRAGTAGARGNQPGAVGPAPAAAEVLQPGPSTKRSRRNLSHGSTVRNTELPSLRKKSIAVAVLINQPPPFVVTNTSSTATRTAGRFALVDVPMDTSHGLPNMEVLSGLIVAAAGLDVPNGDRLELATMPFFRAPDTIAASSVEAEIPPWYTSLPLWAYGVMAGSVLLFMFAVVLAVRRRNQRRAEEEAELVMIPTRADEVEAALEGTDYEPAPTLAELRTKVHELVLHNGDLAAEILSAWINDKKKALAGAAELES